MELIVLSNGPAYLPGLPCIKAALTLLTLNHTLTLTLQGAKEIRIKITIKRSGSTHCLVPSVPRIHVHAYQPRRNACEFFAPFVINDAEQLVRARAGQITGPSRDGSLKISLGFEGFHLPGKFAECPTFQIKNSEDDLADLIALVWRHGQITRDLGFHVLGPRRIAPNRHHHGSAGPPLRQFEPVHKLDLPQTGWLLDGQRAAIRERAKDARAAIAVTEFRVDRNQGVELRLELREIRPWQLELDLHPALRPARGNLHSDLFDRAEVTRAKAKTAGHIGVLQARPVTVDRPGIGIRRPGLAPEIFLLARVEVPFHPVAFPKMIVIRLVSRFGVERAQSGVKGFVVPHVKNWAARFLRSEL